jgi:hypothetical protein
MEYLVNQVKRILTQCLYTLAGGRLLRITGKRENKIHMAKRIVHVTILVNDYDEAIDFYINRLGFSLIEDTRINESKRWVLVSPNNSANFCLLLARASNDSQKNRKGNS